MKKKKVFTNYPFKQLFIDKETKELVQFFCPGFKGEDEVIVLSNKKNQGLIFCPIEEFHNKYQIDQEYAELIIYKNGEKRNFKINNSKIDLSCIDTLYSMAKEVLNNFDDVEYVIGNGYEGHRSKQNTI